ncbi:FAD-dependent oxidoreductase [Caldinitratiruptor microaerophilus]|uniref:FAD-dependent oxidoreductase n=1 Tax=Caldinitratiruptor microaerophilus TaxID=671077 RepID=UPI00222EE0C2|nr:FAD-dependent oxidoreductase [Caldinitratiruptor microaerophilus]
MADRRRRLVVVGGVAAGMSAASRARRRDPDLEIVAYEASSHVSYGSCGLPYLISGQVRRPEDLVVVTPERFKSERNILALTRHEVLAIDPWGRTVTVRDPSGSTFKTEYDVLVLSTGGRASRPPVPGADLTGVFTLRTLDDGIALLEYLRGHAPRRAVIVGAGYIGVEMAEAFRTIGLEVAVVEMLPRPLSNFDPDLSELARAEMERNGVALYFGEPLQALEGDVRVRRVVTPSRTLDADLVLFAGGVRPAATLARDAGIALGPTGAVQVTARMETNVPGIYAAGDVAEVHHLLSDRPAYIPLGSTANKQGRVAGENAAGGDATFPGVVGTAVLKAFGLELARTGLSTDEARQAGFDPVSAVVRHGSRAHYYPGGGRITVKVIADRQSGRLLGAQMAGPEGVAKRIDIFATALHARMTPEEVAELDLSYAPPFAPVWDPVLVAARAAVKELGGSD